MILYYRLDEGGDDVEEVKQGKEEEDSVHFFSVWHSLTLTNGEILYAYESH